MLMNTSPQLMRQTRHSNGLRHHHLGLSLVEMLVGITLGIFLIGGAMSMLMTNLKGSQTLLLEARINQDLRATADIISRDLKRSGYWGNAISGTTMATGATAVTSNPYSNVTCTSCTSGTSSQVLYGYTKDTTENNTLDANEQFGFKLNGGAVQMQTTSGTWQTLTDTNILTVTSLSIQAATTTISVADACATTPTSNAPTTTVRRYDVTLTGQAVSDSTIARTLKTSVRVRNDQISGACP